MLDAESVDWSSLPWNRRFRRSVARSPEGFVLVALEPFASAWKGFGRIVRIADSERGLGSNLVFQLLMSWASKGRIGGVVKGEPGHPDAFGSQGQSAWDLLEDVRTSDEWDCSHERYPELVRLLRMWLVFAVAQAFKDVQGQKDSPCVELEKPEEGCQDPEELARWALARAAQRISERNQQQREKPTGGVFLVFGPGCDSARRGKRGAGTLLTSLVNAYGLHEADFDQGCFGAPGVYDTRLVTSSWFLFEALHEVRVKDEERLYLDAIRDS